jgi:hypothetical protein
MSVPSEAIDAATNAMVGRARFPVNPAYLREMATNALEAAMPFLHCQSCDGHSCPDDAS